MNSCMNMLLSPRCLSAHEGRRINAQRNKDMKEKDAAQPGVHYTAVESSSNTYFLFPPETPGHFRHAWALVRKRRPDVVVIERLFLPSVKRKPVYNAQYCSLFFRPWTLLQGDATVPHLSLLGMTASSLREVYETRKDCASRKIGKKRRPEPPVSTLHKVDWTSSWSEYVRGNVVSASAAKLIQSFLLNTLGSSGKAADDLASEADDTEDEVDLPPMKVSREKFQDLLRSERTAGAEPVEAEEAAKVALRPVSKSKLKAARNRSTRNQGYQKSQRIGEVVWKTAPCAVDASDRGNPGNMHEFDYQDHLDALTAEAKQEDKFEDPFNEKRCQSAMYNPSKNEKHIDDVLNSIRAGAKKPNDEQQAFLNDFAERLKAERREQVSNTINKGSGEPLLDLIHGFPGTGKSAVIAWMREIMEEGLGWEHGVQFVCLAFQNAMAAHINGFTVHHWSGIPARNEEGSGTGDKHKLSMRCQALRVIIIDEVSMLWAELLGTLDKVVTDAVRVRNTYKKRSDDSTRAFGGVNVVMCADFWQLQPVTGTFLASNPYDVPYGLARNALDLFWGNGENSNGIRKYTELTQLMRCDDEWYNHFLKQCRVGKLSMEDYAYFHGLPTLASPCCPTQDRRGDACTCNGDIENDPIMGGPYRKDWKNQFLHGNLDMAQFLLSNEAECQLCRAERSRRHRVLTPNAPLDPALRQPPFTGAPALYTFNVPRYFATNLRAKEWAKQENIQLSWCHARDVPLHPGDRELPAEALNEKRYSWLRRHDQETSHIPSIYPLAKGMPIRLTENVDRNRQLYRGRTGVIHGWTLAPNCASEEIDGEFVLDTLPLVIYLQFPGAKWRVGKLGPGIYPLKRRTRTWKVNKHTGIEARRTGFWILPDFGSTAHMIQGATLEAAFADLQDASNAGSMTSQIAAYVCLSRVKMLLRMCVLQPFSTFLFSRGDPVGPRRLVRKLRGEITAEEAADEWFQDSREDAFQEEKKDPMSMKHLCASCYLQGKGEYMLNAKNFGVTSADDYYSKYVSQGAWTRCLQCQKQSGVKVPSSSAGNPGR